MKKSFLTTFILFLSLSAFSANSFRSIETIPEDTGEVAKAHSLHKKVVDEKRIIKSFDQATSVTLPQGISKKIGNQENIIVLESMTFTPQGAKMTAYMSSDIPRSEQKLALKGKDINFCPGGFTGGARLELMEDVKIKMGNSMSLVIKGAAETSRTYVECDCKGYKAMGLKGEIQFSDSILTPVDTYGNEIPNSKVKVGFETQLVGWDDLLIEVGISPFKIKKVNDFSFQVNSAVFDFSEAANSPVMQFPEAYESSDFTDGDRKMWKGFFLKDLIVTYSGIDDSKKDANGKQTVMPPTIEAHNLIIDNIGVSGKFMGKNIIPIETGSLGNWPFALDEISAEIMKNQFASCGLKGRLTIPPLGDTTTIGFEAFIDANNNYSFVVKNKDTLNMDILMAKLQLNPNSSIDISRINGKFKPKAILNGKLSLATKETEIAGITFEELVITPEAPYLKAKAFSFGEPKSNQKLGKFPINISKIGFKTENDRAGLNFNLRVNLVEEGSGGFSGEAGLGIYAKSYMSNDRQRWKYDGLEVSRIAIDIDGGAYKIAGSAEWYKNDSTYGNGFTGTLSAEFKAVGKVEATAIFGNLKGMRYFYADALLDLKKGIPVFTGINLYSFGGGVYHHMRQLGYNESTNSTLGVTRSGIVYKPDERTAFGFKATVGFGLTKREAFNADLTLEMAFNTSGGVDRIVFLGNGYFMTPPISENMAKLANQCKKLSGGVDPNSPDQIESGERGSIRAKAKIDFDFRNELMHSNLSIYIQMPGDIIKGIGPGGLAGSAVMHFAKDEWYVYIGTPTERVGISVLDIAEFNSYFMMGTNIPESPPPPAKVSEILGGIDLNYMSDLNSLGTGKGICFGAGLSLNAKGINFPPFYAEFAMGLGFDVMLKNYGNVSCRGRSEPLGVNGWYANGQIWAYLEGAIGIRVNWRFIKGDYEIIRVGAAAVLQAQLPNPFWMRGIVGGRYSILGGMIKGSCRLEFEVGEKCEIVGGGSPVQAIEVISELTPDEGSTEINVFNAPQAIFNMPIGKVFSLQDFNGNSINFKIELDHFKLLDGNKEIIGDLEWNADKDVLAFKSFEILPPQKKLDLEVQVSFKERKLGRWLTVMDSGKVVVENMHISFTTGKAPEAIPLSNVLYSYPMPMMYNYYQNETDMGYIQLKQGMAYLFTPGPKWKQIGRFVDKQGIKHEFDFTYIPAEKKVNFKHPGNLLNNNIYTFELVNVPAQEKEAIDKNVVTKENKQNVVEGNESTIEISTKEAEGNIDILDEKNIFEISFRTSLYNSFVDKLHAMQFSSFLRYHVYPTVHHLYNYYDGNELFESLEVNGNEFIRPMIQIDANLDNKWYRDLIDPLVYKENSSNGLSISWRENDLLGIPPTKAVYVYQYPIEIKLTDDQVRYGIDNTKPLWLGFTYRLPYFMNKDFYDLLSWATKKYCLSESIPPRVKYLLENDFRAIYKGVYNVNIQYVLPGFSTGSSTAEIKFNNPVGAE